MYKAVLGTLRELISAFGIYYAAFSLIKNIFNGNPYYELYVSYIHKVMAVVFIFGFIYFYISYSIKQNSAIVDYRIMNDPESFNLDINKLKEKMCFIKIVYKRENEDSYWYKVLDLISCNIFLDVQCPLGVIVNAEQESSTDFKIVEEEVKTQSVLCTSPISAYGTREALYSIGLDSTNFKGGYPIKIKIYIAPQRHLLNKISIIEIGKTSIDINTSTV